MYFVAGDERLILVSLATQHMEYRRDLPPYSCAKPSDMEAVIIPFITLRRDAGRRVKTATDNWKAVKNYEFIDLPGEVSPGLQARRLFPR